jgi:hypothetical protein
MYHSNPPRPARPAPNVAPSGELSRARRHGGSDRRPFRLAALPALLVIAALLATAWPLNAHAHGGRIALRTTAGPYRIEAVVSRTGGMIDESITLTEAATGQVVQAGVVSVTLTHPDGRTLGPFVARGAAGVFEARYPPPEGVGWTVTLAIAGPAGTAEASHPYRAPGGGGSPLLTVIAGVALFVVMPVLAWRIWWRKDSAP